MRAKRSLALIFTSSSFVVGILARHVVTASWVLIFAIATFSIIIVTGITHQFLFALFLGGFLILGFWRSSLHEDYMNSIRKLYGQKVIVAGTIADDPTLNDRGFLLFSLDVQTINHRPASGSLMVRTYNQKLRRGYQIAASSKLDGTLGNKVGELVYASIAIQSSKLSSLEQWRQRYFAGMRSALPEPSASFALGLLLGTRGLIPSDVQDMLRAVGLTHLIAVSGYNLTILINAARKPLRNLSKFLALVTPLWLIFLFMLLTGFSASIVRAAIVSSLSLLATYYGRSYKPMVLLMFSAVATLAYNPAYLWSDVGWQLSFLAFYGILVLAPLLSTQIRSENMLVGLAVESSAAYIITIPLIMWLFGNVSIIAPVANLIILPLVPLVMLLAFIAGIFGIASPLAPVLALPLKLLLALMLGTMNFLAHLPAASTTIKITGAMALAYYGVILFLIATLHIQSRRRSFMVR